MKRLVALLLGFTVLFALVACTKAKSETETKSAAATDESVTEEKIEAETKETKTQTATEEKNTQGSGETPTTTTLAPTTTTLAPTTTTAAPPTTTLPVIRPPALRVVVTTFENEKLNGRFEPGKVSPVVMEAHWQQNIFFVKVALVNTTGVEQKVYLKSFVVRGTDGQVVCDVTFGAPMLFCVQNNSYSAYTFRVTGNSAPNQRTDIRTPTIEAVIDSKYEK